MTMMLRWLERWPFRSRLGNGAGQHPGPRRQDAMRGAALLRIISLRYRVLAFILLLSIFTVTVIAAKHDLAALGERAREHRARVGDAKLSAGTQMLERMLDHVHALHMLGRFSWLLETEGDDARAEALRDHLRNIVRNAHNDIMQFAVIDRHGRLAWSTVAGFSPVDLSDREHFAVHARGGGKVFFSEPLVGRASGRWSVQITTGIFKADGTFNGVVVASIDPLGLSRDLAAISGSSNDFFTLVREDGVILARSNEAENFMRRSVPPAIIARLRETQSASAEGVIASGGEVVFSRWNAVPGWPLFLVYNQDAAALEEQLAARRQQLGVALVLINGLALGLIALLLLALAHRRSLRDGEREAAARRSLSEVINALPAAVYRLTLSQDGSLRSVHTGPRFALQGDCAGPGSVADDWGGGLSEEDRLARAAMLIDVAGGSERMIEYKLREASGRIRWIRDHASRLRRAADGSVEVVGIVSDVTREREAATRSHHADRLASLGGMATGMAHEMSQPAAAIALAADLALLDLRPGRGTDQTRLMIRLEEICDHAMRMRDVVDLFRIFGQSDKSDRPGEYVDLPALVAGARRLTQGSMESAGVAVHVSLPSACPCVFGRRVALEQVLVNLFLNARDALMESGAAVREVTLAASVLEDELGRWLRIAVRDNGPGFSEEALKRWAEPFFTTKASGKGTGLGLSIAHGIVKSFGGSMALANHDGAEIEILLVAEPAHSPQTLENLVGSDRQDG